MSSQILQLKQSEKALILCKEISLPTQNLVTYIAATFDGFLFLIHYQTQIKKFTYLEFPRISQETVTQIYYDRMKLQLYAGTVGGDIEKWPLAKIGVRIQNSIHFSQKKRNSFNPIILIYRRLNHVLCWDSERKIKILDCESLKKINEVTLSHQIAYAISFFNPFSRVDSACVAFNIEAPPIIYDCEVQNIFQCTQSSLSIFQAESMSQGQIYIISNSDFNYGMQNFIICGVRESEKNWVSVYEIIRENQKLDICFLLYRFDCEQEVLSLHLKSDTIAISLWNEVIFYTFSSRRKLYNFSRKDTNIAWIFIIEKKDNQISFMLERGFNYRDPKNSKTSSPKFRTALKKLEN